MPDQDETTPARAAFDAALAHARTPDEAFAALQTLADATVGARLFTILTVDLEAMLARRAYTSHPVAYPTSGTKPIERNDWFAQVVDRQEIFATNTLAGIATVFPDHALIGALGCGAVINLPVVVGGQVVASVNMLDAEGSYTPDVVERARAELTAPAHAAVTRRFPEAT